MFKTYLRFLLSTSLLLLFLSSGVTDVFGKKPPWAGGPGGPDDYDPPPVSAPEPNALSLIGVAIAGGAGYYFIRRRQKK